MMQSFEQELRISLEDFIEEVKILFEESFEVKITNVDDQTINVSFHSGDQFKLKFVKYI